MMSYTRKSRVVWIAAAVAVILGFAGCTSKKEYPAKPIEIIVPFAPGGAVDITARILGAEVEKNLGQKVLIVNKPGGGAAEGQGFVARAAADGYTLLAITSSVVTNTLTKQVDFKIDSFQPVVLYCFDYEVLLVSGDSPYKTLDDLLAAAKKSQLNLATPGHSTSHHTAGLILEKKTGVKFKYIHTKGATEQVPMIAGGHAPVGLAAWGEVRSMAEQGKIRILGVMSEKRDPRIPDVPTFKEKGVDIVYGAWRGIAGPKGMAPEIVAKLDQALKKAIESKEVQDKFKQSGFPLCYDGQESFA
jgi:tripartite-type tricarboxylate transporter receptor subunit TctC